MTDRFEPVRGNSTSRFGRAATFAMLVASCTVVTAVIGQFAVTPVEQFGVVDKLGANSSASLVLGSDGYFYGTTFAGGGAVRGTVFRLSGDGTNLAVLHRFPEFSGDGAGVYAGVIEAADGLLYGTTGEGGISNKGTIFRVGRDGSGYRILHSFTGTNGDGAQGFGAMTEGSDQWLYGATRYGGNTNKGTIFRIDLEGANYEVLHHFTGTHNGGAEPVGRVVEGPDGRLYGTTHGATIEAGSTNQGTVFGMNRDGTGYVVLRPFTGVGEDGASPYAELTIGRDGLIYGATAGGGTEKRGLLFRLRPDGSEYQVLHHFGSVTVDGATPYVPLLESEEGTLHGMTSFGGTNGLGVAFTLQRDGSGYRLLHQFLGDATDGGVPYGAFAKGADGALYGTSWYGGAADRGTIFRMRPDGSEYAVLQQFIGAGDGAEPYAGLSVGTNGTFYGTTWGGGKVYKGTVYRVRPGGGEAEILHEFAGGTSDGEKPYGGVIEGSDGMLYGTTVQGGTENLGIIYKMDQAGNGFTNLRSFRSASGGAYYPYGSLIEGSDGALYGTTVSGGNFNYGTVFRINRAGGGYDVLRIFRGGNDGAHPYAGVVEGSDGYLYGVTAFGGGSDRGTVFAIRRNGEGYTVVRRFSGSEDGRNPYGRLLAGDGGIVFGTTSGGGRSDSGMIFSVVRIGGEYRSLYQFDGSSAQGLNPLGGLSEGPDGMLYGTTTGGGQQGVGTLYRIHRDGSAFEVQYHFRGEAGDGANPSGELVKGSDGLFYGTSRTGGIGCGTVYRLAPRVTLYLEPGGLVGLTGPTGFVYSVQGSLEPAAAGPWLTLTNVTMTTNPTQVQIPGYGADSKQFFRTVLEP